MMVQDQLPFQQPPQDPQNIVRPRHTHKDELTVPIRIIQRSRVTDPLDDAEIG